MSVLNNIKELIRGVEIMKRYYEILLLGKKSLCGLPTLTSSSSSDQFNNSKQVNCIFY